MKHAHFVLQGKGGVGKTFVACLLAQFYAQKCGVDTYNTDVVNDTLSRFEALAVTNIPLMENNEINTRNFDALIEALLSRENSAVIDNGAATFVPLMAYMCESDALTVLKENGVQPVIHVVLTGGQARSDTLDGLTGILEATEVPVVVWFNEFFGQIFEPGETLADHPAIADHLHRIANAITLPARNPDTYGVDIQTMVKNHLTFTQALSADSIGLMAKQRLRVVRDDVFHQLDGLQYG